MARWRVAVGAVGPPAAALWRRCGSTARGRRRVAAAAVAAAMTSPCRRSPRRWRGRRRFGPVRPVRRRTAGEGRQCDHAGNDFPQAAPLRAELGPRRARNGPAPEYASYYSSISVAVQRGPDASNPIRLDRAAGPEMGRLVLDARIEQVVLPHPVDAQILPRIALALEAGFLQQARSRPRWSECRPPPADAGAA